MFTTVSGEDRVWRQGVEKEFLEKGSHSTEGRVVSQGVTPIWDAGGGEEAPGRRNGNVLPLYLYCTHLAETSPS